MRRSTRIPNSSVEKPIYFQTGAGVGVLTRSRNKQSI